jgi:hypothetical protein
LTVSPVTKVEPPAGSSATTSPVLTPVRVRKRTPHVCSSSSFSRPSAVRISAAARTARTASSSWSCGTPNTAMISSPMNFSIVPPWRSTTRRISSK